MVTPNSGVVVKNNGRDTAQVAAAMAREISSLLASTERLALLSAGAVLRAREFILAQRIERLYDWAMKFIARPA